MQTFTTKDVNKAIERASDMGMKQNGYFGTFKLPFYTFMPLRVEHLSSLHMQWLQKMQLPVAAIIYTYKKVLDVCVGPKVITEVRTCISIDEMEKVVGMVAELENGCIESVVISPLMEDAIYFSVPNYSERSISRSWGTPRFHQTNSYNCQAELLNSSFGDLKPSEDFDNPYVNGGDNIHPMGNVYVEEKSGMTVVIPFSTTLYNK